MLPLWSPIADISFQQIHWLCSFQSGWILSGFPGRWWSSWCLLFWRLDYQEGVTSLTCCSSQLLCLFHIQCVWAKAWIRCACGTWIKCLMLAVTVNFCLSSGIIFLLYFYSTWRVGWPSSQTWRNSLSATEQQNTIPVDVPNPWCPWHQRRCWGQLLLQTLGCPETTEIFVVKVLAFCFETDEGSKERNSLSHNKLEYFWGSTALLQYFTMMI